MHVNFAAECKKMQCLPAASLQIKPHEKNLIAAYYWQMSTSPAIDAYIALQYALAIPRLNEMRALLKSLLPNAEEVISYGMPAFKQGKVVCYYAGYKHHIGFYPGSEPIKHFESQLTKYKYSKGAIQFALDKPLPAQLIKRIVKYQLEKMQVK